MIQQGIGVFRGKRVLLLQGPVGPFFARLAADLRSNGVEVFKVNFNAGDWLFYPRDAMNYRGKPEDWPDWLESKLGELQIDAVLLFGDCRPIHQVAHAVATRLGVEVGVFEEGYVRPDYVTLERFGVNGYSRLPRIPDAYAGEPGAVPQRHVVGGAYWSMAWCAFIYFLVGSSGKFAFPFYRHHRPMSLSEGWPWVRSVWRKLWYRFKEKGVLDELTTCFSKRFYLVPLQVFNDSQVTMHTELDSVTHFIEEVVRSFANHAPLDTLLVFKHHPMDRGYRSYTKLLSTLASKYKVKHRVMYIHDQHLPSLLDHACGAVVINSTVGLSALHHQTPTMVCGTALYDMPGLTFQGELDDFWHAAPNAKPDRALFQRFRNYLVATTQLNGSFYKPLKVPGAIAGLIWGGAKRNKRCISHPLRIEHQPKVSRRCLTDQWSDQESQ